MEPYIVTFTSIKGGAGKTTLATGVASEMHRRRRRVGIIDADDVQRSAMKFARAAREHGHAAPPVVAMDDDIERRLHRWAEGYELVIVDTPCRVIRRVAWALEVSDMAVMPCGPAAVDIWAMEPTLEQMRLVMAQNTRLVPRVLIAKKQPNTVIGRMARKAFDDTGFEVMETELEYRVDYAEATGLGLGPTTYKPQEKAADEVNRLVNEIEQLLALSPMPKRRRRAAA
jgi:chromosome partitioning protein